MLKQDFYDRDDFFKKIRDKYYMTLFLKAVGLCGKYSFPVAYARDFVEMLFRAILEDHEKFIKGYAKYGKKYIFKSLQNEFKQERRSETARINRELVTSPYDSQNAFEITDTTDPDQSAETFIERLQIILTPGQFEAMDLYLKGFKQREIAEMLELTTSGVSTRIRRAKDRIANQMESASLYRRATVTHLRRQKKIKLQKPEDAWHALENDAKPVFV